MAEILKTQEVFHGPRNFEDSVVWNGSSKIRFTISSAYHSLSGTDSIHPDWPWKFLWKVEAPFKVACLHC